jgi:hypothetical protein
LFSNELYLYLYLCVSLCSKAVFNILCQYFQLFRIEEKNDEIKSLRSMMKSESQRMDAILQDLDSTRQQLREKSQLAETLLVESSAKSEEMKVIPKIAQDLEECRANLNSLQSQHKQNLFEKVQLATHAETQAAALETVRADLKQRESSLHSAEIEITRLTRDIAELSTKADGVELVSRDNERLKGSVARLETDVLGLNHRISEYKRELEHAHEEIEKAVAERESAKEQVRSLQLKLEGAQDQNEAYVIQDRSERERRSAAEAALAETRIVLQQSRDELQVERRHKLDAERRTQEIEEEAREMRRGLGQACVMSFNAMQEWDDSLSTIIDGEVFSNHTRGSSLSVFGSSSSSRSSQAHRSQSSPHRSQHQQRHQEEGHHADLLGASHDVLLQRVAVRVERVGLKLQRMEKIRSLFISHGEKLVESLQQGMNIAHEKVTLYHHKLAETQAQLQKLQNTVQRDRKQRDDETQELMHFKEVVLSQHTAQIRDSEMRFAQQSQQLEHEKNRADELQRKVAEQSDELRSLAQTNMRMQEDLEMLERTEKVVADLSHRASEMVEVNRQLSHENESKANVVSQLTSDNHDLKQELSATIARVQNLMQQLRAREEAIEESDAKLQGFLREIERLRTRQIHPDLAKTIQDTQNILQGAVRVGGGVTGSALSMMEIPSGGARGSGNGGGSNGGGAVSISRDSLDSISEYIIQIERVEHSASSLLHRTTEMVTSFEAHMNSSARVTRGAAAVAEMKQEIFDLLDANSRLAVQMQQLVGDFKKALRQLSSNLLSSVAEAAAGNEDSGVGSGGNGGGAHGGAPGPGSPSSLHMEDLRVDVHSSRSRSPLTRYDGFAEPSYTSSIRGGARLGAGANSSSSSMYTASQRAAKAPQSPEAASAGVSKSARFHSSPTSHAGGAGAGLFPSAAASSLASASFRPYDSSAPSRTYGGYTPGTASRTSANKLNKLGSDLDALARKLDSYDTYRPK